ncbi:hypothetical protein PAXRUDRAFT_18482 [Paxillus rubicundulus Ve08.2h10]|uniref:Uncharacterized protein n=1 Tax=Paxillus rubicundulus Ve08.2h10 TaxID=930991 RepID=A0A0D0CLE5_9AGAM|nr:hypothetical protein PAXRUDRAFT_18482 [Paxillus rubicundulus Ve08.2h10]
MEEPPDLNRQHPTMGQWMWKSLRKSREIGPTKKSPVMSMDSPVPGQSIIAWESKPEVGDSMMKGVKRKKLMAKADLIGSGQQPQDVCGKGW